jgi:signal recognition particle subunit SRP54
VFDTLSDRLTQVFSSLRGRGRLSPADIDATCREIRIALLEADVALPVVRPFIARIKERASGEEVSAALNPAQQVIKIVNEELIGILGGEARRLRFAKVPPTVILLAGLQGSGKTTLAAKLALWLKEQGNTPMLVAADLQRPNAVQQLQVVGERAGVPVYAPQPGNGVGDPVAVARDSLEEARRRQQNMVIIDTAGRLGVDADMMAQAVAIRDATQPDEILFVVDAMIGQDAVATAQAFLDGVGYDGVVLTKLDGDARGGAALSIVELTGRPIMFASSGEKLEDFDMFHPDRMASRILDMGDILTLIEQAEKTFDADQTANLAGRLASGEGFTLEDFVEQLSMVRKLGPIGNLLGMLPGAGRYREQLDQVNDKDLDRAEAIVRSMTPEERRNPKVINGSRRARIAQGSGVAIGEVAQLVTNFFEGQKQMKAMFSGGIPGMPPMPGLGAAHRAAGKSARKKGKKKAPRSGDPRRAAEIARGGGGQDGGPVGSGGPAGGLGGPGGLGGLPGGLPEGFPESLADGLANLPPGLNFPPAPPAQGNIPAAFRGGNKRKKK